MSAGLSRLDGQASVRARRSGDVHGGNFRICQARSVFITAIAGLGAELFCQLRGLFLVATNKGHQLRAFAMREGREDRTLSDGAKSNYSKADFVFSSHG